MLILFCYTAYANRRVMAAAAFSASCIGMPAFLYLHLVKGQVARSKSLLTIIILMALFTAAYFSLFLMRNYY